MQVRALPGRPNKKEKMENYKEEIRLWKAKGKQLDAIGNFIEELNCILAEANIYEPAGYGCGYAVEFDENAVAAQLQDFYQTWKQIEEN